MALSSLICEQWLPDLSPYHLNPAQKLELDAKIREFGKRNTHRALAFLIDNLYSHDYAALKRDFVKIALTDAEREPTIEERHELLRVLWWCINLFFHGDYSAILDECEKALNAGGVVPPPTT